MAIPRHWRQIKKVVSPASKPRLGSATGPSRSWKRPKNSHTNLVERHHRLAREAYLKTKRQLDSDGVVCDQQDILDAAIEAKNCLNTIHGVTPQEATFGVR